MAEVWVGCSQDLGLFIQKKLKYWLTIRKDLRRFHWKEIEGFRPEVTAGEQQAPRGRHSRALITPQDFLPTGFKRSLFAKGLARVVLF